MRKNFLVGVKILPATFKNSASFEGIRGFYEGDDESGRRYEESDKGKNSLNHSGGKMVDLRGMGGNFETNSKNADRDNEKSFNNVKIDRRMLLQKNINNNNDNNKNNNNNSKNYKKVNDDNQDETVQLNYGFQGKLF